MNVREEVVDALEDIGEDCKTLWRHLEEGPVEYDMAAFFKSIISRANDAVKALEGDATS